MSDVLALVSFLFVILCAVIGAAGGLMAAESFEIAVEAAMFVGGIVGIMVGLAVGATIGTRRR